MEDKGGKLQSTWVVTGKIVLNPQWVQSFRLQQLPINETEGEESLKFKQVFAMG